MTRRERFAATLRHEPPDSLVLDLGGCPLSSTEGGSHKRLLAHLGIAPGDDGVRWPSRPGRLNEQLLERLDIDTRSVGGILEPESALAQRVSDMEYVDCWGLRRQFTGQYWEIVEHPLRGATTADLAAFDWPDPARIPDATLDTVRDEARALYEETDYVVCGEHPVYGVFELGCWMCGFDEFLMRTLAEPDFVAAFFDRVLDYQKAVIERYYGRIGTYIHYTSSGDDFATQGSTFLAPGLFRSAVAPYFAERIAHTKRFTNAAYLHHSCGNVFALVPALIECGVDILNPIQPAAPEMAPARLAEAYGRCVVFHGGIDTQNVLRAGTPEDVAAHVAEVARAFRGTGYVCAAAHNIQDDVPPENVVALFDTARALAP